MVSLETAPNLHPPSRLEQLEKQRTSYYQLLQRLETLPRKLRHPGLIPVAPRLFLQGELVRTNEVLVLLGRSGNESFLAERSAWQAKGIVQRRLDVVDQHVNRIIRGTYSLNKQLSSNNDFIGVTKDYSKDDTIPSILVDTTKGSVRKSRRKKVTFKDPPHTEFKSDIIPNPTVPPPDETHLNTAKNEKTTVKPNNYQSKQKSNEENITQIIDLTENKLPTITRNDNVSNQERNEAQSEFSEAIRNAATQQIQEGVVNITEFYEDGINTPVKVELPSSYKPDESINFDDDDDQVYLDVSGSATKASSDEPIREDYWKALIEAEKEEEEKEQQRQSLEAQTKLEREKKEFGTGFSKGFFASSSTKSQTKKKNKEQSPKPITIISPDNTVSSDTNSDVSTTTSLETEGNSNFAIKERIVERKPKTKKRSSNRRHNFYKQQRNQVSGAPAVDSLLIMSDDPYEEPEEMTFTQDETDPSSEGKTSQFRRLRSLQRQDTQ